MSDHGEHEHQVDLRDVDMSGMHYYAIVVGDDVAGKFGYSDGLGPLSENFGQNPTIVHLPPEKRGPSEGWKYDKKTNAFSPGPWEVKPYYNPPADYPRVFAVVVKGIVVGLWAMPIQWPENIFAGMCSDPRLVEVVDGSPVDYGWTYDAKSGDFLSPVVDG